MDICSWKNRMEHCYRRRSRRRPHSTTRKSKGHRCESDRRTRRGPSVTMLMLAATTGTCSTATVILCLLFGSVSLPDLVSAAFPASPMPFNYTRPDGTVVQLRMAGVGGKVFVEDLAGYTCVEEGRTSYIISAARSPEMSHLVYASPDRGNKSGLRRDNDDGDDLIPIAGLSCGIVEAQSGHVHPAALYGIKPHIRPGRRLIEEKCGDYCRHSRERNRRRILEAVSVDDTNQSQQRRRRLNAGTLNCAVILIRFQNHVERELPSKENVQVLMDLNGDHPTLAPTGSVRKLFKANSYNKLDLRSKVFDWVTVSQNEAYYANKAAGLNVKIHEALREALDIHNEMETNFKQFDNKEAMSDGTSGDGNIDAILFLHSGYAGEFGYYDCDGIYYQDRIWSHEWNMTKKWTSHDGVSISDYPINSAFYGSCGNDIARVGPLAHELYHYIGLPDLYDTDTGNGAGNFGIMAHAWGWDETQMRPPQLMPWCKKSGGWVKTLLIEEPGTYSISASWNNDAIYRIDRGFPPGEYILLENKVRKGIETEMPAEGLILWKVDENMRAKGNELEGMPGQPGWPANGRHYMVAILQADGNYDLEHGRNQGDRFDFYSSCFVDEIAPSVDLLKGPFPNSDFYQNGAGLGRTGLRIYDIGEPDEDMKISIDFDYSVPTKNHPHGKRRLFGPSNGVQSSSGIMFDVQAKTDLTITEFDILLNSTEIHKITIYAKEGSHTGDPISDESAWTILTPISISVTGRTADCKCNVKDFTTWPIRRGETHSFYLAHEFANAVEDLKLKYGNPPQGSTTGSISFGNDDLDVLTGTGRAFPFDHPFIVPNRDFNGIVHYTYGLNVPPPKPTPRPPTSPPPSPRPPIAIPTPVPPQPQPTPVQVTGQSTNIDKQKQQQAKVFKASLPLDKADNQAQGIMFDVKADQPVTILSYDIHVDTTSRFNVKIYHRMGSYVGHNNDPNLEGWTLDCDLEISGKGLGEVTSIPLHGSTGPPCATRDSQGGYDVIQSEQVMAIYIVVDEGVKMVYSTGTYEGAPFVKNTAFTIHQGIGKGIFFDTYSPRIFHGGLYYSYA